jgi:epsilon-lactone hydrolase
VWLGMHHVFQLNVAELVSAGRALDRAAGFLSQDMARAGRRSGA